ncbi:MAG: undecaprenyl-diphosphate phosphatase [Candidatus Firestonebacteria bacterium]
MSLIEAIILGIVQGLTEFIPVSSSGHLVILQNLFKDFNQPGVLFDSLLHLGTLTAVLYYFRLRLYEILTNKRLLLLIVIASVPTGIIGFVFKESFEKMFSNVRLVGAGLIVTGIVLFFSDRIKSGAKSSSKTTFIDALIIGVAQGIAIIPGISRSGATIVSGIYRKLDKQFAMEFSFLLSIPAITGAVILQLRHVAKNGAGSIELLPYICGFCAAAIVGYLTIRLVLNFLLQQKLYIFSIYLWLVGSIVLIFGR